MRAAAAIVAFSGVRLEVLGNYLGDDGLKVRDFPELKIHKDTVEIQELVRRRQMQALGLNGNGRQRVVLTDDVKSWVLQGREFVNTLPSGEATTRLPET